MLVLKDDIIEDVILVAAHRQQRQRPDCLHPTKKTMRIYQFDYKMALNNSSNT